MDERSRRELRDAIAETIRRHTSISAPEFDIARPREVIGSEAAAEAIMSGPLSGLLGGIEYDAAKSPTKTYPDHCCQDCGEAIGHIGRFLQKTLLDPHRCTPRSDRGNAT